MLTKSRARTDVGAGKRKIVCLPYFHYVSHNLKAIAGKFGVTVVFKPDFRLDRLVSFLSRRSGCSKRHREPSVPCDLSVVYKIPVNCGGCYVGQTSSV